METSGLSDKMTLSGSFLWQNKTLVSAHLYIYSIDYTPIVFLKKDTSICHDWKWTMLTETPEFDEPCICSHLILNLLFEFCLSVVHNPGILCIHLQKFPHHSAFWTPNNHGINTGQQICHQILLFQGYHTTCQMIILWNEGHSSAWREHWW